MFTGEILASELKIHGFSVSKISIYHVESEGTIQDTYRLNYILRTGHRVLLKIGGFRASTYNALPVESVKALVDVMKEFEKKK